MPVIIRIGRESKIRLIDRSMLIIHDKAAVIIHNFKTGFGINSLIMSRLRITYYDPSADIIYAEYLGFSLFIRIKFSVLIINKSTVAVSAYHNLSGRHIPVRFNLKALNAASHVSEDLVQGARARDQIAVFIRQIIILFVGCRNNIVRARKSFHSARELTLSCLILALLDCFIKALNRGIHHGQKRFFIHGKARKIIAVFFHFSDIDR